MFTIPRKPRVVVLGMMGLWPYAGLAVQVLHYLEALARLGYEPYYVEDTTTWPYDPVENAISGDCSYTVAYIARIMRRVGGARRWAYRLGPDSTVHGLSEMELARLYDGAEALINLCGATLLREEHMRVPVRIYLETDPVGPQLEIDEGRQTTIDILASHTHHFTFGENIGKPACPIPAKIFHYRPTRQPVVLDWWRPPLLSRRKVLPVEARYTTIANWKQTDKDFVWRGEAYTWSKHVEFLKFKDLPSISGQTFELALACDQGEDRDVMCASGWRVIDSTAISLEVAPYFRYILDSAAEFTVAKDQNIRLRSGWFSDRSACYLAAGRPVITQDTGFGDVLPTGEGLFSFRTMDDILEAVEAISSDYPRQSRAAREIAAECFHAETVVRNIALQSGLPVRQRSLSPLVHSRPIVAR